MTEIRTTKEDAFKQALTIVNGALHGKKIAYPRRQTFKKFLEMPRKTVSKRQGLITRLLSGRSFK